MTRYRVTYYRAVLERVDVDVFNSSTRNEAFQEARHAVKQWESDGCRRVTSRNIEVTRHGEVGPDEILENVLNACDTRVELID